ncbi:MAG: hypothetical protein LBV16_01750 [Elusimicrobiota bacterium]|jgi:hypothetical protein|nr:hypothetical protein [Elusimicrobiota bacterium]
MPRLSRHSRVPRQLRHSRVFLSGIHFHRKARRFLIVFVVFSRFSLFLSVSIENPLLADNYRRSIALRLNLDSRQIRSAMTARDKIAPLFVGLGLGFVIAYMTLCCQLWTCLCCCGLDPQSLSFLFFIIPNRLTNSVIPESCYRESKLKNNGESGFPTKTFGNDKQDVFTDFSSNMTMTILFRKLATLFEYYVNKPAFTQTDYISAQLQYIYSLYINCARYLL